MGRVAPMRLARLNSSGRATHIYVDNDKFWQALKRYKDDGYPPLRYHPDGDYIGACILKICSNLSCSANFIGYSYRDEMIDDAVETCIKYIRAFDPDKSHYAFTYFSKTAYYAFIRRLKREKQHAILKYRVMSDSSALSEIMDQMDQCGESEHVQSMIDSLQSYLKDGDLLYGDLVNEHKAERRRREPKPVPTTHYSLGSFMES